jgi:hypothetical protein
LLVQQGGLDASTPGEQWASLGRSLSSGKLSGEQMRQLYSQNLLGFAGEQKRRNGHTVAGAIACSRLLLCKKVRPGCS